MGVEACAKCCRQGGNLFLDRYPECVNQDISGLIPEKRIAVPTGIIVMIL
jgi:hypothetical protein